MCLYCTYSIQHACKKSHDRPTGESHRRDTANKWIDKRRQLLHCAPTLKALQHRWQLCSSKSPWGRCHHVGRRMTCSVGEALKAEPKKGIAFREIDCKKNGRQLKETWILNRAKGLGIHRFYVPIMAMKRKILKIASTGRWNLARQRGSRLHIDDHFILRLKAASVGFPHFTPRCSATGSHELLKCHVFFMFASKNRSKRFLDVYRRSVHLNCKETKVHDRKYHHLNRLLHSQLQVKTLVSTYINSASTSAPAKPHITASIWTP